MINITEEQLSNMYKIFDNMDLKANDYVPKKDELDEIMDNLVEYMKFLMWIEETGYETEENKDMRARINKIIKDELNITD